MSAMISECVARADGKDSACAIDRKIVGGGKSLCTDAICNKTVGGGEIASNCPNCKG